MHNKPKPPIVIDTNILVSAVISPNSTTANAVRKAFKEYDIYLSKTTLAEFLEVIQRKKFDKYFLKRPDNRKEFVRTLLCAACFIQPTLTITDCPDPKDNQFLEIALSCRALYLVTGDKKDLLAMNPYQGVQIITATGFLNTQAPNI